jgi:hypothetical protein
MKTTISNRFDNKRITVDEGSEGLDYKYPVKIKYQDKYDGIWGGKSVGLYTKKDARRLARAILDITGEPCEHRNFSQGYSAKGEGHAKCNACGEEIKFIYTIQEED